MVCDFVIYQGETTFQKERENGFTLGESTIIYLTQSLVPGHIIYHDQYFSSLKLADHGFRSSGTINNLRVPRAAILKGDSELKKEGREVIHMKVRDDGKIYLVK